MAIEILIFASVMIGVIAGLLLEQMRKRIEPAATGANALQIGSGGEPGLPALRPEARMPAAAQLRLVADARFAAKRLLSDNGVEVLAVLETMIAELGRDWRVMAGVKLDEIIASADRAANAVIGDQRVDMLIVSADQMPIAAVEYQSLGQIREDAAVHDAVKKEALRRAGIAYFEVRANEPLDALRIQVARLAAVEAPPPPEPPRTVATRKARARATPRPPTPTP